MPVTKALCEGMKDQLVTFKCTVCGRRRSHEISNLIEWYEEYHPNLSVSDPVPNKCIDCCNGLKLGQQVVVRSSIGDSHIGRCGDVGFITNIYTSSAGEIYEVNFGEGSEYELFLQIELKPVT